MISVTIQLYAQESIPVDTLNIAPKSELSYSLAAGGAPKLTAFLPQFNFIRRNQSDFLDLYYGLGIGLHVHFQGGFGTFNGIVGVEKKWLSVEGSISHFWTTKIIIDQDREVGPFYQNLVNLKLGYKIGNVKVRLGTSFLLSEGIPDGQTAARFINIGKIDRRIYGIDFTAPLKFNRPN
ncbi:MAG: hypothetical protein AAFO07_34235 [Bacteroidota bacterium]